MKSKPFFLGIGGASGSGKSSLANNLKTRLEEMNRTVSILREDCYYHPQDSLTFEQRERINYDHPDSLEHSLLSKHVAALAEGNTAFIPQYDFANHTRMAETEALDPSEFVIIEGILIYQFPELRTQFDCRLFVDVPIEICLSRRVERDTLERGRSKESVLNQFEATVKPMFFEFVEPSKQYADIIVTRGGENAAALDLLAHGLNAITTTVLD